MIFISDFLNVMEDCQNQNQNCGDGVSFVDFSSGVMKTLGEGATL